MHAIIKKLKNVHGNEYDWIHAYPEEWNELKLTSKVLQDLCVMVACSSLLVPVAISGSLSKGAGHPLAVYEALLRNAVTEVKAHEHKAQFDEDCTTYDGKVFWQWLDSLRD